MRGKKVWGERERRREGEGKEGERRGEGEGEEEEGRKYEGLREAEGRKEGEEEISEGGREVGRKQKWKEQLMTTVAKDSLKLLQLHWQVVPRRCDCLL